MLILFLIPGDNMRILVVLLLATLALPLTVAQQDNSQPAAPESAKPAPKKDKKQPAAAMAATPEKTAESVSPAMSSKPDASDAAANNDKDERYDVAEVPPVVTH